MQTLRSCNQRVDHFRGCARVRQARVAHIGIEVGAARHDHPVEGLKGESSDKRSGHGAPRDDSRDDPERPLDDAS
eukprot:5412211-Pyramimonas_sp.AAC.1